MYPVGAAGRRPACLLTRQIHAVAAASLALLEQLPQHAPEARLIAHEQPAEWAQAQRCAAEAATLLCEAKHSRVAAAQVLKISALVRMLESPNRDVVERGARTLRAPPAAPWTSRG